MIAEITDPSYQNHEPYLGAVGLFIDFSARFIIHLAGHTCSRVVLAISRVKDSESNHCHDVTFVDDRAFCVHGLT